MKLFSMPIEKLDKWMNIFDSLSQTLRPIARPQMKAVTVKFNISTTLKKHSVDLGYLSSILQKNIVNKQALKSTEFISFGDCLIILLFGDGLFKPRSAILKDNAQSTLFFLGGIFQNMETEVTINDHTEQKPRIGGVFASNWGLSAWWTASLTTDLCGAVYQYKMMSPVLVDSKYRTLLRTNVAQHRSKKSQIDITVFPTIRAGV